jgi:hypothetical protein
MPETALKFILLLVATVLLNSTVTAAEITGVVKSADGKPLSGVQVKTNAPAGPAKILGREVSESIKQLETTTDASGAFKLAGHGRVIHFHRDDLRPLSVVTALGLQSIKVTMEDGNGTLWKTPACSATDKATKVGVGFMMTPAANVMVRKDTGRFEDGGYFFGYQTDAKVELMVNWWESTSLVPQDKFLVDGREFSQRMWRSGEKWGYEFRGTLRDGTMWRQVTLKNGAIAYQTTSK